MGASSLCPLNRTRAVAGQSQVFGVVELELAAHVGAYRLTTHLAFLIPVYAGAHAFMLMRRASPFSRLPCWAAATACRLSACHGGYVLAEIGKERGEDFSGLRGCTRQGRAVPEEMKSEMTMAAAVELVIPHLSNPVMTKTFGIAHAIWPA